MGKPQKHKDNWTPNTVAQERPNILARVDGTMYMAHVESANPDNNTAMIRYSPQPGVNITYQTRLASVVGALNSGNPLYHSSPQPVEAVACDDCAEITQELVDLVNDRDATARRLGSPK